MENQYGIVVHNEYGLGKTFAETKVGGFFGRLFKRVRESKLLMAIPFVSVVVNIGEGLMNGLEELGLRPGGIDNDTLTPKEQTILDTFNDKLFQPFYESLLIKSSKIFESEINVDEQIKRLNDVLSRMCLVEQHFGKTPEAFLSPNALQIRIKYIVETFNVIENEIFRKLEKLNLKQTIVSRNFSDFSFGTLIPRSGITSANCLAYEKTVNTPTDPVKGTNVVNTNSSDLPSKDTNYLVPILILTGVVVVAIVASKKEKQN